MRVTRWNNRYVISCTEHEMEILELAVSNMADDAHAVLPDSGLRRSWARRTNEGPFLRTDTDRRTGNGY